MKELVLISLILIGFVFQPAEIATEKNYLNMSHNNETKWKNCHDSATELVIEFKMLHAYIYREIILYDETMKKIVKIRKLLDLTSAKCEWLTEEISIITNIRRYLEIVEGALKRQSGIYSI